MIFAAVLGAPDPDRLSSDSLPAPSEIGYPAAELVCRALAAIAEHDTLRSYVCDMVRSFPDNEAGWQYLLQVHLAMTIQGKEHIPESIQGIDAGIAAEYRPVNSDERRWLVVESRNPSARFDERAPSDRFANRFLRAGVGDIIHVPGAFGMTDDYMVIRLISRWGYYVMRAFQHVNQLGGGDWCHVVRFDKGGCSGPDEEEIDAARVYAFFERLASEAQKPLEQYRRDPVMLRLLDANTFRATLRALADAEAPLIVHRLPPQEPDCVASWLDGDKAILIDATVCAVIFALRAEGLFDLFDGRLVCGIGCMRVLEEVAHGFGSSAITFHQGKPGIVSESEMKDEKARFEAFLAIVKEKVRSVPCPEVAALEPEWRGTMTKAFGQDGVQAIAVGRRRDLILWTDDGLIDVFASDEGRNRVSRIATYDVLDWALRKGRFRRDEANGLTAKMLLFGLAGHPIDGDILFEALRLTEFHPEDVRIARFVFAPVVSEHTSGQIVAVIFLQCLKKVYEEPLMRETRGAIVDALMRALNGRADVRLIAEGMWMCADSAFGLNVLGAKEFREAVRPWWEMRP